MYTIKKIVSMIAVLFIIAVFTSYCFAESLGDVTDFSVNENTYTFTSGPAQVRVIFYKHGMVRIWLAPDGTFSDPAGNDIIVSHDFPAMTTTWSDEGSHFRLESDRVVIRAYKSPLTFAMYEKDNQTVLWEETEPLSWDTAYTYQRLRRGANEQFYGCGMQNGHFSHRNRSVLIERDFNWNDGGHPNPAPFYMSTGGYGVYRNTWATGQYDFYSTVTSKHKENRFDAFYFYGPGLKEILDGYTELTGRPFMIPIYALELGDADCYNSEGTTPMSLR